MRGVDVVAVFWTRQLVHRRHAWARVTATSGQGPRRDPNPDPDSWVQGAALLQLFRSGWMKDDGTPHSEKIFTNMITAAKCSYKRWTNKRWVHAFLRKCAHASVCPLFDVMSWVCHTAQP